MKNRKNGKETRQKRSKSNVKECLYVGTATQAGRIVLTGVDAVAEDVADEAGVRDIQADSGEEVNGACMLEYETSRRLGRVHHSNGRGKGETRVEVPGGGVTETRCCHNSGALW